MNKTPDHSEPVSPALCQLVLVSLRKIIQSIDLHSRFLVKQYGLTGPQLVVLQEIAKAGEAPIGKIAKACSLSQATVTGVLERLEKRRLVARQRSDMDRRQVLVKTTEAGDRLLKDAPPPMQEHFVEHFNQLQDWEQAMILSALQRLVAMMDAGRLQAAPFLTTGPIDEPGETTTGGDRTEKGSQGRLPSIPSGSRQSAVGPNKRIKHG
ncbi:MAG: MarR family transcriptional regulator [Desulfobacterales bacterium]|nr:MarR family transcriptional regulator [Desulfobacterales bacterium]